MLCTPECRVRDTSATGSIHADDAANISRTTQMLFSVASPPLPKCSVACNRQTDGQTDSRLGIATGYRTQWFVEATALIKHFPCQQCAPDSRRRHLVISLQRRRRRRRRHRASFYKPTTDRGCMGRASLDCSILCCGTFTLNPFYRALKRQLLRQEAQLALVTNCRSIQFNWIFSCRRYDENIHAVSQQNDRQMSPLHKQANQWNLVLYMSSILKAK